MKNLRCPRCSRVVQFREGDPLECPHCGFPRPRAPPTPKPAPAAPVPATGGPQTGAGQPDPETRPSPAPRQEWATRRFLEVVRPGLSPYGIFGLILVVASILGIVLGATLPWMVSQEEDFFAQEDEAGWETGYRSDIKEMADGFRLFGIKETLFGPSISWPVLAFVLGIIAGALLFIVDLVPNMRGPRQMLRVILLTGPLIGSFLLALVGFRWLGIYAMELIGSGPPEFHLHAVPYLYLGLGVAILIASASLLRRAAAPIDLPRDRNTWSGEKAVRGPAIALIVTMVSLLLMPVVPYAIGTSEGDDGEEEWGVLNEWALLFFGELSGFAAMFGDFFEELDMEADEEDLIDASNSFSTAYTMLWIAFWVFLAATLLLILERFSFLPYVWSGLAQVTLLSVVPIVVGTIFAVIGYVRLFTAESGGTIAPGFNYFILVAFALQFVGWILFAVHSSRNFFSKLPTAVSEEK